MVSRSLFALAALVAAAPVCAQVPLMPPIDRKAWMVPSPSQPLKVVKTPVITTQYPGPADYMRVLERFPLYGERGWRANYMGQADLGFFGDPEHAEMGLRSMGNFIFVMSLLASDSDYDPAVTGISREQVLSRARSCLEYMTRAHVTGDITCGNGKPWGDHWQSAWWTAKMALGARLIWDRLTPEEKARVERVVVHEADRHLERTAPGGALSNTRSEENAWDTEVMAAAIALFPAHSRAAAWRAKLIEFDLNSLSVAADAESDIVVDGKPLREQVYTENAHPDFTIENHGAYHTCYMSCPLHSLAWGYYALKSSGQPVPEAQFHHFRDVWSRMKPTFLQERFAYPEGKDWPRYAYGMYFIMPALVALQQEFGDADARFIEARRFGAFEREQVWNADGSFFGRRFTLNQMMDRLAEYETDCYANLGVCYLMHRMRKEDPIAAPSPSEFAKNASVVHISEGAEVAWARTPDLFVSFAWKVLSGRMPIALFIPAGMDSAAEWRENNLCGRIAVDDVDMKTARCFHRDETTPDGFRTQGRIAYSKKDGTAAYTHSIVFEADTRENTATIESTFRADGDIRVTAIEGLRMMVANDFFNGGKRVCEDAGGQRTLRFDIEAPQPETEVLTPVPLAAGWVNIDGRLGVVNLMDRDAVFTLRQSNRRNAQWGSLHFDALDCPAEWTGQKQFRRGDVILHTEVKLVAGDAARTRELGGRSAR